jgi:hypothetical protein
MIGEVDIDGVFAPALMLWGAVALAVSFPVRWALSRVGAYRLVWHRGLFDIAIVILLWAIVAATAAHFTFPC